MLTQKDLCNPGKISSPGAEVAGRVGKKLQGWFSAILEPFIPRTSREETLCQRIAELERHSRQLNAFAHNVAHDLKAPLGLIVGFAELVEENHTSLPEESLRHYLRNIMRTGYKMSNIVDELLLLAEMQELEVQTEALDMAGVVSQAKKRLHFMIQRSQVRLTLPARWPTARGYGPWVEEVWVNYLSNAIKYGGQPPRLELGADFQENGQLRFWVRDNGPGLTREEQARLFLPFERLEQVHTEGHGLGLAIVQEIVQKLGGQVAVESQIGRGSLFAFTLPAAER